MNRKTPEAGKAANEPRPYWIDTGPQFDIMTPIDPTSDYPLDR